MLDETEGSGKDQFLGDPDWLSEIQCNTIQFGTGPFQSSSVSLSMRCKKLEGSGYEIVTVWKARFYSEHAQNSVQSRTRIVKRYSARKGEKLKKDLKSVKRRPPFNVLQQKALGTRLQITMEIFGCAKLVYISCR